ncbi:MAG: cytochrome c biogenesis protein CcdA [Halobacteriales archaeon]|nr:cytochrome c biogenesis protein CcdA [Halobacteriales archaeon]
MAEPLTMGIAFGAGLLSFLSPCVVPIVPGYLAFVTGGEHVARGARMTRTLAFVLGFGVAFVVLGLVIGAAGTSGLVGMGTRWAERLGGAFIIAFGLVMLGLVKLPFLDRDVRWHGAAPARAGPVGGALLLGTAFGVGWSPCMGPILASILLLAGLQGSIAASGTLLGAYALGLAVPFILIGFGAERVTPALKRFARVSHVVELVGGVLLIAIGIAVFTGATARLTSLLV